MANFNVHVLVAAGSSILVATLGVNLGIADLFHLPWLVFLGLIGGMLPDIDSVNSKPVKLLFNVLALFSATAILSLLQKYVEFYQLLVLTVMGYWLTRYLVVAIIARFTVHRGIFHSLLALVFFVLTMVCITHYAFKQNALFSWLNGFFIGFGFFVHLLLDEMYSVDLSNKRIKKSFGTALKLFNYRNLSSSALMGLMTIFLYWLCPTFPVELTMLTRKITLFFTT